MEFQVPLHIPPLPNLLNYQDKILLVGSCFTEHIGNRLQELKFSVLQNPHGILFDSLSVAESLLSYIEPKTYRESDLFYLNEVWQSWQHHSRFAHIQPAQAVAQINAAQEEAGRFLQQATCVIITLGSSFSYRLTELVPAAQRAGAWPVDQAVANCHRAPAQWFRKHLMTTEETISVLGYCLQRLLELNPAMQIIFTVSPVRHIRDGVIDNNRSKARLIEAVHSLVAQFKQAYYFPAYELVIDVLRDYRFFDVDMVHPNYPATEFVMEKFIASCIEPTTQKAMEEIKKLVTAAKHKPFQPQTHAHRQFLQTHLEKTKAMQERFPYLDFGNELDYFSR